VWVAFELHFQRRLSTTALALINTVSGANQACLFMHFVQVL
jgi:hypothetical protein